MPRFSIFFVKTRCSLESKRLLFNKHGQSNLAALLTRSIVCARGANDDLCLHEFVLHDHSPLHDGPQPKFTQKNRSALRAETSSDALGAPMALHDNFEHRQLGSRTCVTAQQQTSPD